MTEPRVYTEEEVARLRHEWESDEFEAKTKEVLAQISHRLDESNNYKDTIGRNVRTTMERIEVLETARRTEANQIKEDLLKKREWWQDNFVRLGITFAIFYEVISIARLLHWV